MSIDTSLNNRILAYVQRYRPLQDDPDEFVGQLPRDDVIAHALGVDVASVAAALYAMRDCGLIWAEGNANYGPIIGWFSDMLDTRTDPTDGRAGRRIGGNDERRTEHV